MANRRATIPPQNGGQKIVKPGKFAPITLVGSNDEEAATLREYAEFWKVPFTTVSRDGGNHLVLSSNPGILANRLSPGPVIISPTGTNGAANIAKQLGLEATSKETLVRLRSSPGASVSFRATLHEFSSPNLEKKMLDGGHNAILYRIHGSNVYVLAVDLIAEYRKLFIESMNENPNWKFSLVTRMPFSYNLIPSKIRNRAFKTKQDLASVREEIYGPVECLRLIFLASIVIASPDPVPIIRFWRRGKSYALAISHDVETQLGLEDGAGRLFEVEKELGIRSTWNIPSDRYPLSSQLLISLATNGEVGAHDTKHDGKLLFTTGKAKLERVRRCKERLERLSGREVQGFRAPLLQHSLALVEALGEADYDYDSSMPSWEPLSPTSLKPHGVGTVFPFMISDTVEIPVSMPQDHQLMRAGRLKVYEAVDYLLKLSAWIKNNGGACVLLVHPDYEFSQEAGLGEYRRLLGSFHSDPSCDVMTLGDLARWWAYRQQSYIDDSGKILTKQNRRGKDNTGELEVGLVAGYGPDGLVIQNPSIINTVETNENPKQGR